MCHVQENVFRKVRVDDLNIDMFLEVQMTHVAKYDVYLDRLGLASMYVTSINICLKTYTVYHVKVCVGEGNRVEHPRGEARNSGFPKTVNTDLQVWEYIGTRTLGTLYQAPGT